MQTQKRWTRSKQMVWTPPGPSLSGPCPPCWGLLPPLGKLQPPLGPRPCLDGHPRSCAPLGVQGPCHPRLGRHPSQQPPNCPSPFPFPGPLLPFFRLACPPRPLCPCLGSTPVPARGASASARRRHPSFNLGCLLAPVRRPAWRRPHQCSCQAPVLWAWVAQILTWCPLGTDGPRT